MNKIIYNKKNIVVAVITFLLYVGFTCAVACFSGFSVFKGSTWGHWDSGLYLSIANDGFQYIPSGDGFWYDGNVGWMPLYPILIRYIHAIVPFVDVTFVGVAISGVFLFVYILSIYSFLGCDRNTILITSVLLLFPGNQWLISVFPTSMSLAFMMLNLLAIKKEKYVFASICGFLCVLSYSTMFLLAIVDFVFIYAIEYYRTQSSLIKCFVGSIKKSIMPCISIAAGIISWCLFLLYKFHDFFAFFNVQKKYGHGIHNPFETILLNLNDVYNIHNGESWFSWAIIINFYLLVYIAMVVLYLILERHDSNDWMFGAIAIIFYGFMQVMGQGVSPYRQYAIIGLSVPLFKNAPKYIKLLMFIISIFIYIPLLVMFFNSTAV